MCPTQYIITTYYIKKSPDSNQSQSHCGALNLKISAQKLPFLPFVHKINDHDCLSKRFLATLGDDYSHSYLQLPILEKISKKLQIYLKIATK